MDLLALIREATYTAFVIASRNNNNNKSKSIYLKWKKKWLFTKAIEKIGMSGDQYCKCLNQHSLSVKAVSTEEDSRLNSNPLPHLVCYP